MYFCRMKERINWIDWAKALAVCSVVFCHLPQSQEWFYYRYLQALTMVVFFFISGYLKKNRGSDKENWKKYWYGLIVPYIIYNVVVYPYWILKYYLVHGGMPDVFQAMRPLIGALLMEHESSFAEPLNGPLWYLPAILFMHILIDLCRKTKYQHRSQQILGVCTSADAHWHHAEFTLLLYGLLVWTISSVQRMSSQNGYHWLHHMSFGKHLTLFLASGSLLCRATCPTHRPLLPYQRTVSLWCFIWL